MPLDKERSSKIQEVVKDILVSRLESFPADASANRNAPFHEAFLNAFSDRLRKTNLEMPYLVAIASWMHGLNGSLGSGFENMAHILSGGYKRKFTGPYTLKVSELQDKAISEIIVQLKSGERTPDLRAEEKLIIDMQSKGNLKPALGFTADVFCETEDSIECIEMKSVRPNSGEGRGEKEKILYAKAALKILNPKKEIRFYVGFPFDPTSEEPTGYDKARFMNYLIEFKKFFSPDEILIASELWDHLSGQKKTMEQILQIVTDTVNQLNATEQL